MAPPPLPALALAGTLLSLSVGASVGTTLAVRRWAPRARFGRQNTDLGQIFGGAVGTLFALVFALVTVAVWQNYDRVAGGVGEEANCVHNLYRYLESYPEDFRQGQQALLRAYVREVVEREWRAQRERRTDLAARRIITDFNARMTAYRPTSAGDMPLHMEVLAQLSRLRALRHDRERAGGDYLDPPMWISLMAGAMILVIFCSLWDVASLKEHLTFAGALGASMGIVFFLMAAYNHPFRGPAAIAAEPFEVLLQNHW
jgi:hypothetical protein